MDLKPATLQKILTISLVLVAAACGTAVPASLAPTPTLTPVTTPTPDPCHTENLPATVKPVNDFMRQFDDYAALASNIVQSQVIQVMPPMQAIRRAAQDQAVPACLVDLKRFELSYMEATLQTLLAFEKPSPNAAALATGIVQARHYHDQYALELARLLGVTIAAPTAATPGAPTP